MLTILPPPGPDHGRVGGPGAQEGAGQVAVEYGVPFGEIVVFGLLADVDPGVVDQDVEPSEPLQAAVDQGLALGIDGNVGRDRYRLGAQPLELATATALFAALRPATPRPHPPAPTRAPSPARCRHCRP